MRFLLIFFVSLIPIVGFSLEVSTTIKPLHTLLSAISKDVFTPHLIIDSDSPHRYQLTPHAQRLMQSSDIIFYINKEFEPFAYKNKQDNWIELLPLMPNIVDINEHQKDTHIWLDPDNAIAIAKIMTSTLSSYDSQNAIIYQRNAEELIKRINFAVKDIQKMFSNVTDVNYVVIHDAYSYFTRYFNIKSGIILLKNNQEHITPKSLYQLNDEEFACIMSDPYHTNVAPSKIFQKTRLVIIDPLGQNENHYTDLLYSIGMAFQKCFNR